MGSDRFCTMRTPYCEDHWPSSIALAVNALVSSVEVPAIEAGRDSVMHMDEVAPGAVVASTPTYSMFQIDAVSLRLRWPVTWMLRDARGIAMIENVTW